MVPVAHSVCQLLVQLKRACTAQIYGQTSLVNAAGNDEEGVGPALQQQLRSFQLPHLRGEVQRGHARFVRYVDFRACVKQLAGGLDVAVAGSVVQCGTTVALAKKSQAELERRERVKKERREMITLN